MANEHLSNKDQERCARRLYSLHKSKGKRKGGFNIDCGDHLYLTQRDCEYCGAPPSNTLTYRGLEYSYNGLDRKDNDVGYCLENVVVACAFCNSLRGPMKWKTWSSFIASVVRTHGGQVPSWLQGEDEERSSKSFYRHG